MKRGLLVSAGLVLLAVIVSIAWLLQTEGGLRFAFARLTAALPLAVTADRVEGRLGGTISIAGLAVSDGEFRLRAGQSELELSLLRLFAGEVHLRKLVMSAVEIDPGTKQATGEGEAAISRAAPEPVLPFKLRVDSFAARDIGLLQPGQAPLRARSLNFTDLLFAERQWRVSNIQVDSELLTGQGDITYLAGGKHDIRMHFKGSVQVYDNKLELITSIEGNEERILLTQALAGAVSGQVKAQLDSAFAGSSWVASADLAFADLGLLRPGLPGGELRASFAARGQGAETTGKGTFALAGQPALELLLELNNAPEGVSVRRFELNEKGGPARVTFVGKLMLSVPFPDIDGNLRWESFSWPLARGADEVPVINSPDGSIQVRGADGSYELNGQATLGNLATEGTFSTAGVLDLRNDQQRFDLQGQWDALAIRTAQRSYVARAGHYSLSGLVSDYRFDSGFELLGEGWPALNIMAAGHGNQQTLNFELLEASSTAGRVSGRGEIGLADGYPFDLAIQGKAINPGAFAGDWPGRIDLEATLKGLLASEDPEVNVNLQRLKGTLRGQPITASAAFGYANETLSLTRLDANWADAEAFAAGSLGTRMDFAWRISIPDLATLTGQGKGRFSSAGKIAGSRLRPLLVAQLEGEELALAEYSVQQLRADANIDFANRNLSTLTAVGSDIDISGNAISKLELQGGGEADNHRASLRVETEQGVMSTELSGALDNRRWLGSVADTRLALATGEWLQDAASALRISATDWSLAKTCLRRDPALVCASAERVQGAAAGIELFLTSLPLAELGLLLPEGLEYAGSVSGHARVQGLGEIPQGTASFEVAGGKVWQIIDDEELVLVNFRSMQGEARLADGRLRFNALLREPGSPEVSLEASLPYEQWAFAQGPIEGRLDGTLASLGLLSVLFPDIADIKGRVETQLRLSGTMATPVWDGHAELIDAQAVVPGLGITLSGLTARVDASANKLRLSGQVMSGQGALELSGEFSVSDGSARGRMQLRGQDFLAADLPEARIVMTPQLALDLEGKAMRLEGDVRIVEARIAPRDLSGAIQRSPDEQILRGDGVPAETKGWQLSSRVRIAFGDKVSFDGFGLEARIAGAVTAVDEPGRVTTATGEVQIVDGTYVAYGRKLEVRRGRLLFTGGPLDDPGLDILALRKIDGGPEVGVIARATLSQPELNLYSDPSMQSAQILSYLLVGQSLSDVEGVDRQLVNDTATRLATAGGGLLAQQLGRRFGLGDVRVASGSTAGEASLVIGKYLSPRLYASYGIGLFEPVNTLRLRYALSSKWNLSAESGLNQSVDLEFSLDR